MKIEDANGNIKPPEKPTPTPRSNCRRKIFSVLLTLVIALWIMKVILDVQDTASQTRSFRPPRFRLAAKQVTAKPDIKVDIKSDIEVDIKADIKVEPVKKPAKVEPAKVSPTVSTPQKTYKLNPVERTEIFMFRAAKDTGVNDVPLDTTSILWPQGCPTDKTETSIPQCTDKPIQRIMLIKTHKAGGSTLSGIFTRYGQKHDVTFALPRYEAAHICWPGLFRTNALWAYDVMQKLGMDIEMLTQHTTYERCIIKEIMPKKTTFYVTTLRDPVYQLRSSLYYYPYVLGKNNGIDKLTEFMSKPDKYNVLKTWVAGRIRESNLYRNAQSMDLGFPYSQRENQTAINLFLKRLDHDFDLVVIIEYFYESLVLLRRMLCWTFRDMLNVKLNSNVRYGRFKDASIADSLKTSIRKWSAVDTYIYNYFRSKLELKIRLQPPDFEEEVRQLKETSQKVNDFCFGLMRTRARATKIEFPENKFSEAFTLTAIDCQLLGTMPHTMTGNLRRQLAQKIKRHGAL